MTLPVFSLALLLGAASVEAGAVPAGMVVVGPAALERATPAPKQEPTVEVKAFALDVLPVTNAQFLAFVTAQSKWQRGRAPTLFVDEHYLKAWPGPLALGARAAPDAPVVGVSWFAARAYCARRAARLPLTDEWELAAQASATSRNGARDPEHTQKILAWYAKKTPSTLPAVGKGEKNVWGVQDLHRLVWEWVEDFGAVLVSSDNRVSGEQDIVRFCGGGAQNAVNPADYASFMRLAFRSSLEARYTTQNLGFRCAADVAQPRSKHKPAPVHAVEPSTERDGVR